MGKIVKFTVLLCGVFAICNAYAFKPRIYPFPEQVICADKIIVGDVSRMNSQIHIRVREYLKGDGDNELNVQYDCIREKDRPIFKDTERVILFLREGNEGELKLLGYGDQAVWPKKNTKWPFSSSHVCTAQDVVVATTNLVQIEDEPMLEKKVTRLRQMLTSEKLFTRTVATEYIDLQANKGRMDQMEQDVCSLISHEGDRYLLSLGISVLHKIRQLRSIDDRISATNSSNRVSGPAACMIKMCNIGNELG